MATRTYCRVAMFMLKLYPWLPLTKTAGNGAYHHLTPARFTPKKYTFSPFSGNSGRVYSWHAPKISCPIRNLPAPGMSEILPTYGVNL